MKKILTFLLCIIIVCAIPLVAFAEEEISTAVDTDTTVTENLTTETENATESEISATEEATEEVTIETPADTDAAMVTTEAVVKWVETHLEEISVIITLIATLIYQVRKHSSLNKSIVTLNNNSVGVVDESNKAIKKALERVESVSTTVDSYKEEIILLLSEIRKNDEEKKKLETALTEVESYLKTAKLANTELANEVAELLVLANIPNAKKEELYSRHRAAVAAIATAEHKETEVKEDVGEEA